MKNAHYTILAAAVSVFLLTANGAVFAEGQEWSEEQLNRKHEMMMDIYKELGLTEEQQSQIKARRDALKEGQSGLREQIKAKRAALKAALDKEGVTKAEVDRITDELIVLIGQKVKNRVNGIWATKEILSPEQFRLFLEKKENFKEKFRKDREYEGDGS